MPFCTGYQFDFINWFYWSLWWQQYSYNWAMYQQQQAMMGYQPTAANMPSPESGSGSGQPEPRMGMRPNQETSDNANTSNNQQPPAQQYTAWGQPPLAQQWNWNAPQFTGPFQFPGTRMGQVYLRIIAGMCFEWRIKTHAHNCVGMFLLVRL